MAHFVEGSCQCTDLIRCIHLYIIHAHISRSQLIGMGRLRQQARRHSDRYRRMAAWTRSKAASTVSPDKRQAAPSPDNPASWSRRACSIKPPARSGTAMQISVAVGEGAKAGRAAIAYVKERLAAAKRQAG